MHAKHIPPNHSFPYKIWSFIVHPVFDSHLLIACVHLKFCCPSCLWLSMICFAFEVVHPVFIFTLPGICVSMHAMLRWGRVGSGLSVITTLDFTSKQTITLICLYSKPSSCLQLVASAKFQLFVVLNSLIYLLTCTGLACKHAQCWG